MSGVGVSGVERRPGECRDRGSPPLETGSRPPPGRQVSLPAASASAGFRTLLIKGDTFKEKELSVERHERSDGSLSETRILTDKFVPVIRGIDFTPGPQFGSIVTIR